MSASRLVLEPLDCWLQLYYPSVRVERVSISPEGIPEVEFRPIPLPQISSLQTS